MSIVITCPQKLLVCLGTHPAGVLSTPCLQGVEAVLHVLHDCYGYSYPGGLFLAAVDVMLEKATAVQPVQELLQAIAGGGLQEKLNSSWAALQLAAKLMYSSASAEAPVGHIGLLSRCTDSVCFLHHVWRVVARTAPVCRSRACSCRWQAVTGAASKRSYYKRQRCSS
jgi:hypothetical protein